MSKQALIVSPYLDHLGGGERYMLSIAEALEKIGYQIVFAWDNLEEINSLAHMLGISLSHPTLLPEIKPLYFSHNPLKMYLATRKYDVVFYLSDGSLPMLGGRKNIVHMQVPFHDVGGRSLKNQIKNMYIEAVVVNSAFTKGVVDKEFGIRSVVVYPPVQISDVKKEKTKTILSVGRFEPSLNAKKQDVLIDAFRELSHQIPGWKLILAGASASTDWVKKLEKKAAGLPVEFKINVSYDTLTKLYAAARIYWHAAGYGVDENKNPELVEHFGITTAEAIGYRCIPFVIPYGGQKEIVTDVSLQWVSIDQLVNKTLSCIKAQEWESSLANLSIDRYNEEEFHKSIAALVT